MNKVDFASLADDNAPYFIGNGVKKVINSLKEASHELFYWYAGNQIRANPDKCHLLTSSSDEMSICVDNYNLNFNTHVGEICQKGGQKINELPLTWTYQNDAYC